MDISPLVSELLKAHSTDPIHKKTYSIERLNEFLREAYTINQRISELRTYLRAIRQPYLSTAPPPRRKRIQETDASSQNQHLTDTQRDQIDAESKSVLRDLHAAVSSLSQAEQNRQLAQSALTEKRRRKRGLGALGHWAAGGTSTEKTPEEEAEDAQFNGVKAHREGVIWFLQRRLEECGSVQSTMMETRLTREMEKSKSILYNSKNFNGALPIRDDTYDAKPARESKSKGFSAALEDEMNQTSGGSGLSDEQVQALAEENKNMLKHYEDKLDQVRAAEKSLVEISELQSTLAANLEIQSVHIDQLAQDSYLTAENVGKGNQELKRATERRSMALVALMATAGFCSFVVLWDLIV